ncbi:hypothetical protein FQA39_LY00625 [Lamprigera yunnana]|nr:hypothetical protein FQA39_LY00625 [Lamprigera yunnana]
MHSRGKKLVNLALLEGNKQVDNNATPTGSSEVQMNDDFNDFGSDDSVADKDYVPSATSSSESELDVGGKSDSESDILNAENSDTEVENTQVEILFNCEEFLIGEEHVAGKNPFESSRYFINRLAIIRSSDAPIFCRLSSIGLEEQNDHGS